MTSTHGGTISSQGSLPVITHSNGKLPAVLELESLHERSIFWYAQFQPRGLLWPSATDATCFHLESDDDQLILCNFFCQCRTCIQSSLHSPDVNKKSSNTEVCMLTYADVCWHARDGLCFAFHIECEVDKTPYLFYRAS